MPNKITPEALRMLRENPPPQVLRSMRELEILLLEHKAKKLREALDADQADIEFAFHADRVEFKRSKGWDSSSEE